MMYKKALNTAFIFALLGVIIGAMGAHALKPYFPTATAREAYETAVRYQFYHSFALLFTGVLHLLYPGRWIRYATVSFVAGILLFCGSIYLLVFLEIMGITGVRGIGILTPIGGVGFIAGWLCLLIAINKRQKNQ